MAVAMVSDELKRTALQLYKEEAQSLFCFKHLKCCRQMKIVYEITIVICMRRRGSRRRDRKSELVTNWYRGLWTDLQTAMLNIISYPQICLHYWPDWLAEFRPETDTHIHTQKKSYSIYSTCDGVKIPNSYLNTSKQPKMLS